jgi:hypothetical protein
MLVACLGMGFGGYGSNRGMKKANRHLDGVGEEVRGCVVYGYASGGLGVDGDVSIEG